MSITHITEFEAAPGQEDTLAALLAEGRKRMRGELGCEAFEVLHDKENTQRFAFVQRWSSAEAHDESFRSLILESGHLEKVMECLVGPPSQRTFDTVS